MILKESRGLAAVARSGSSMAAGVEMKTFGGRNGWIHIRDQLPGSARGAVCLSQAQVFGGTEHEGAFGI